MYLEPLPLPAVPRWVWIALATLGLVGSGLGIGSCVRSRRGEVLVRQSTEAHERALQHAAVAPVLEGQAQQLGKQARALAPRLAADQVAVDQARAVAQMAPLPDPPAAPDPRSVLISALETQVSGLKLALAVKTAEAQAWQGASMKWHAAYDEEARARRFLEIAHEGHVAALKAERWKGRAEGALFGGLAGLAGGTAR